MGFDDVLRSSLQTQTFKECLMTIRMTIPGLIPIAGLMLAFAACSSGGTTQSTDASGGGDSAIADGGGGDSMEPNGCGVVGATQACLCAGGANGAQACQSDGSFSTCDCGSQPIDCQLGPWSGWSTCSADCGGGTQTRSRSVEVAAQHGGKACGATTESRSCNESPCVVQGSLPSFVCSGNTYKCYGKVSSGGSTHYAVWDVGVAAEAIPSGDGYVGVLGTSCSSATGKCESQLDFGGGQYYATFGATLTNNAPADNGYVSVLKYVCSGNTYKCLAQLDFAGGGYTASWSVGVAPK